MLLIILTYIAGVLTILSPCILPVLPFVFARSQQNFLKNGLPLLLGMSLTFSTFSALAIAGGHLLATANDWGRVISMVFMSIFGLSLIFPQISEKLVAPLTNMGNKIGQGSKEDSPLGSILIGVSTGLLWAPCAGPILGLVLTGAGSQGNLSTSIALLISYSLGASTSLGLALFAGKKFFGTLKKFLGADQVVKKFLGVAVILGVLCIAFHLDQTLLTQISKIETFSLETKLLEMWQPSKKLQAGSDGSEGVLPELAGASTWLNSKPLSKSDLLGKVVLVDFWTYSCINCLRTLPYVKAWTEKFKNNDFIVIGIHTPEFAFEKETKNVESAVKNLAITYPVAVDSEYNIWNAFQNQYWPAHYFIDRQGRIRHHHFGEGNYDESEKFIRELLAENGSEVKVQEVDMKSEGAEVPSVAPAEVSPETYVGYERAENFSSPTATVENKSANYKAEKSLPLNHWSIEGKWLVAAEKISLQKNGGKLFYRFHARDLHLVLGSDRKVKFRVTMDGKPLGKNHGSDTDSEGIGTVDGHRLYQLIRRSDLENSDPTFEIEFLESGVDVYAFTFG